MTTPAKLEDLRFWLKEVIYAPQYAGKIINAIPKLIATIEANQANQAKNQQLAEEFRRLAAEADEKGSVAGDFSVWNELNSRARAFEQAAQMLEERLNG